VYLNDRGADLLAELLLIRPAVAFADPTAD
jgi:hypothetical protein